MIFDNPAAVGNDVDLAMFIMATGALQGGQASIHFGTLVDGLTARIGCRAITIVSGTATRIARIAAGGRTAVSGRCDDRASRAVSSVQTMPGMTATVPRTMPGKAIEAETMSTTVMAQADAVASAPTVTPSVPAAVAETEAVATTSVAKAMPSVAAKTMMSTVMASMVTAVMSAPVMLRLGRCRNRQRDKCQGKHWQCQHCEIT